MSGLVRRMVERVVESSLGSIVETVAEVAAKQVVGLLSKKDSPLRPLIACAVGALINEQVSERISAARLREEVQEAIADVDWDDLAKDAVDAAIPDIDWSDHVSDAVNDAAGEVDWDEFARDGVDWPTVAVEVLAEDEAMSGAADRAIGRELGEILLAASKEQSERARRAAIGVAAAGDLNRLVAEVATETAEHEEVIEPENGIPSRASLVSEALRALCGATARCQVPDCEEPVSCYGACEDPGNLGFGCDVHCGHGNEDGWCGPVARETVPPILPEMPF